MKRELETWRGWSTWERRSEERWGKSPSSAERAVSECLGWIRRISPNAASILFNSWIRLGSRPTTATTTQRSTSALPALLSHRNDDERASLVWLVRVSLAGTLYTKFVRFGFWGDFRCFASPFSYYRPTHTSLFYFSFQTKIIIAFSCLEKVRIFNIVSSLFLFR